jgi:hypothetical protein
VFESTIICTEVEPFPMGFTGASARLLHWGGRGGLVVLTRLAPGALISEHWHSDADETVYVLDGDFVEGGFAYGPGTFFFGKAGRPHGPHTCSGGCTALMHFPATVDLDFNAVDLEFDAIDCPGTDHVPRAPNRHGPERRALASRPSSPQPGKAAVVRPDARQGVAQHDEAPRPSSRPDRGRRGSRSRPEASHDLGF